MQYRKLGATDLVASELGFGCGSLLSRSNRSESVCALLSALDHGINFFDTAPSYGQGASERILGEIMKDRRREVILATKFGISYGSNWLARSATILKPLARRLMRRSTKARDIAAGFVQSQMDRTDYETGHIVRSVEASLKRLRTDVIDILFMHSPPADVLEREDVYEAIDRLAAAGKIRYSGLACGPPETGFQFLERAAYPRIIQAAYSVTNRESAYLLERAKGEGAAVIARAPFDHGRLFSKMSAIGGVASERGVGAAEIAIRFALDTAPVDIVLASFVNPAHLSANVRALSIPALSPQEIGRLTVS